MMPAAMPVYPPGLGPLLEEDVAPTTSAVFFEVPEEKELSMAAARIKAAKENPSELVKVKVVAPHRVLHEGKPYVGGDVLEVPNDEEHDIWIKSKWVELVPDKPAPVSQKGRS